MPQRKPHWRLLYLSISGADCSPSRHSSGRQVLVGKFLKVVGCWVVVLANQQKNRKGPGFGAEIRVPRKERRGGADVGSQKRQSLL
jgi:hypothetical protein